MNINNVWTASPDRPVTDEVVPPTDRQLLEEINARLTRILPLVELAEAWLKMTPMERVRAGLNTKKR